MPLPSFAPAGSVRPVELARPEPLDAALAPALAVEASADTTELALISGDDRLVVSYDGSFSLAVSTGGRTTSHRGSAVSPRAAVAALLVTSCRSATPHTHPDASDEEGAHDQPADGSHSLDGLRESALDGGGSSDHGVVPRPARAAPTSVVGDVQTGEEQQYAAEPGHPGPRAPDPSHQRVIDLRPLVAVGLFLLATRALIDDPQRITLETLSSARATRADERMWTMAGRGSEPKPRMIRGSVVVQRRRCGKTTCQCADGDRLHEATVLSYSENGRNRTVMLAASQVAGVREAVARYRAAQATLEEAGNAGLAALLAARPGRGR